jgi:hypothetical protein
MGKPTKSTSKKNTKTESTSKKNTKSKAQQERDDKDEEQLRIRKQEIEDELSLRIESKEAAKYMIKQKTKTYSDAVKEGLEELKGEKDIKIKKRELNKINKQLESIADSVDSKNIPDENDEFYNKGSNPIHNDLSGKLRNPMSQFEEYTPGYKLRALKTDHYKLKSSNDQFDEYIKSRYF